uniref:Sodium/hydrogen exchanger n=1 Tax=Parascaris univalens TaxID=6257 RepID=A0A915A478_PARUN
MPKRTACFKYTLFEYFHIIIASLLLIIVQVASALPAEGFDPLNLHEDESETTIGSGAGQPGNDGEHGERGITLFQVHWDHVSAPLTIAFWFTIVTIAKIVFHRFRRMHNLLPDSALLIVLGLFFGYLFHLVYPDEVYLKPDWFFLYLLPPIALDAGYFMPNKDFFRNFGTIMTYAVFGTLYNTVSIGLTLYFLRGYFKMLPSLIEILIFSTLISAVDPVAVLCVFEEIHVNQLLYICVFGESLLNDAVTIVLYQTLNAMLSAGNLVSADYATAGASFFVVSLGGILIGIIWALLTGYTTKHASHLNVVQPLICLLFPYLAYLSSEMVAMSGILAIVMCGLTMKQFVVGNLSRKSLVTVEYFMKTLSSSCEAVIFVYLGISAVSKNHDWDAVFIVVTIASCLLQRFIGVFLLTWLLNIRRVQKIGTVDQFIMSYGGIRGAVCYGLVMSLNGQVVSAKNMFASCTIMVILFTVFVQVRSNVKSVK